MSDDKNQKSSISPFKKSPLDRDFSGAEQNSPTSAKAKNDVFRTSQNSQDSDRNSSNLMNNYDELMNILSKSVPTKKNEQIISPNINITPFNQEEQKAKDSHFSLITQVEKIKSEENEEGEDSGSDFKLTNTQDIKDFYLYTEECLKRYPKICQPTQEELDKLYIESFPFDEELKTKKLAVFDLDETLVHCESKDPSKGDVILIVKNQVGKKIQKFKIGLNIRPYAMESLREIKENYVVIIYTASHRSYADEVLNHLDPNNEVFQYRLYREHCSRVKMGDEYIYVKDLRIFKNIPLSKMLIIDNSALSFAFHLDNGIPILPFYSNKDDVELKVLVNYLNSISHVSDLREENRKFLKMEYFLKKATNQGVEEEFDDSIEEDGGNAFLTLTPCVSENLVEEKKHHEVEDDMFHHHIAKNKNFKNELLSSLDDFAKIFYKK